MSWPTTTRGFAASNRLAEISRRHMEQFRAAPAAAEPPRTETHQPEPEDKEEDMEVHTNGVGGGPHRRRYTDEQKRKMAEDYRAAEDQNAFAAELHMHPTQLRKWAAELIGPGRRGRKWPTKADQPQPAPAKPSKPPPPPRNPPATRVDHDFARELDVLRQLLELPAAARDRIVGYLAAADR